MKEAIIEIKDLRKYFPVSTGFFSSLLSRRELFVHAVDGVSFNIYQGEIFGLAGESGSGKTTTGRVLLRLTDPTSGSIRFKGKDITSLTEAEMKPLRREMQMIFQDPYESLNPRMTINNILLEPLNVQGIGSETERQEKVKMALEAVDLVPPDEFLFRFPHELSGGQRQRVAVARAFVLDPIFIVADEPVSMLDVSIRASVLDIMINLVEKFNASFLYVTHDIALARHMCDRIAVMYLGKVMEMSATEKVVYEPLHPYTKALISAVPSPDPTTKRIEVVIKGEIPSPVNPPSGCRFHTRCPVAIEECRKKEPPLIDVGGEHFVACILVK